MCTTEIKDEYFIKCPYTDEYYQYVIPKGKADKHSFKCSQDPYYYQACGEFPFTTNYLPDGRKFLCTFYVCEKISTGISKSGEFIESKLSCDNKTQCTSNIDEMYCASASTDEIYECSNSQTILREKVCNHKCDCRYCEDEIFCGGFNYGYSCKNSSRYILNTLLCDENYDCVYEDDERNCPKKNKGCLTTLPLSDALRCLPWISCSDMRDQMNCSDSIISPFSCQVQGYPTLISKNIICNRHLRRTNRKIHTNSSAVCDDSLDTVCVSQSPYCFVHKHQLCDQTKDCKDNSDEDSIFCNTLTNRTCQRRFSVNRSELRIPDIWISDGIKDCVDGVDEDEDQWPFCRYKSFFRIIENSNNCEDVFICKFGPKNYIEYKYLCDTIDTCGNENGICKSSHMTSEVHQIGLYLNNQYHLVNCLLGLNQIRDFNTVCTDIRFPDVDILGAEINSLRLPQTQFDCRYFFGEIYVFLSCTGRCYDAECRVSSPIQYNACPGQYTGRVYSLVDNSYLTFVKPVNKMYKVVNLFECKNGRCISYDLVCNLVDNCGDQSDELECSNNFVCNQNSANIPASFIPLSSVCDGIIDCGDLSDECNMNCIKKVIEGTGLKISSWVIGILAVIFNGVSMTKNVGSLRRVKNINVLLNRALIIMIGIGDSLVGLYLVIIASTDFKYGNNYCVRQREWLVGLPCSLCGVVSTVGSQISLFSMTVLSVVRVLGILRGLAVPLPVQTSGIALTLTVVSLIFVSSLGISVLPLVPYYEDTFVNAIYYRNNPLFKGLPTKSTLVRIIGAYYGRIKPTKEGLSWRLLRALIQQMFTQSYGGIQSILLNFYGNDAVCLFKYFVYYDDPQNRYSWAILSLDFICFIFITTSYILVQRVTDKTTRALTKSGCKNAIKSRNKRLQTKVSVIILTDFLCWIPFIVVSGLHTFYVIDASPWYSLFSIVILPINSVINPLLYDETIVSAVQKMFSYTSLLTRSTKTPDTGEHRSNDYALTVLSQE